MNKNYNHHYVPESILRNFAYKKQTVYSLIKNELPITPVNIDKLCLERGFYEVNIKTDESSQQIEKINYDIDIFQKLDDEIAPIVKKIIASEDLRSINSEELNKLIVYTAYQYLRVNSVRKIGNKFLNNEEEVRLAHARILTDSKLVNSVASVLSSYLLDIIKPIAEDEFVISDSPVLWDATGEGIYFPLSPNICLYFHNQKYGLDNRLDSICINELQFRASVKHTIARSESVLTNIKNEFYKEHIVKYITSGKSSYWKCILKTNSSDECIARFADQMDDFKYL